VRASLHILQFNYLFVCWYAIIAIQFNPLSMSFMPELSCFLIDLLGMPCVHAVAAISK
ncbi:hypothetical protein PIB30_112892, partial [Stylosanthes scabra]|nr:hypothetical protein [Stylosanthes scabra]